MKKKKLWTKEDIRTLKTEAKAGRRTNIIAKRLKHSVGALYQKAFAIGVTFGRRGRKPARG